MTLKAWIVGLMVFTSQLALVSPVLAQNSNNINLTYTFDLIDKQANDGDIIISTEKGLTRATSPYSPRIIGVVQDNPLVVYRDPKKPGRPIERSGTVKVNVTDFTGPINIGDYVTSSVIPGKGQKALQSGFILGIATEALPKGKTTRNYEGHEVTNVGQISVAIRIGYIDINQDRSILRFLDAFLASLFQNVKDPEKFIQLTKYMLAAIALLLSLLVAAMTFIRASINGIQAIGRNPLAKRAIFVSIGLNMLLTLLTFSVGAGVALLLIGR